MESARIRQNFLRIRDTNINFILCQFQNRNILFVNTTQPFEIDIEKKLLIFVFLIPRKLYLILINLLSNSDLVLLVSPSMFPKCSTDTASTKMVVSFKGF